MSQAVRPGDQSQQRQPRPSAETLPRGKDGRAYPLVLPGETPTVALSSRQGSEASSISQDDPSLQSRIGELYKILKLINEDRARYGVPPLKWNDQLAEHAREWAEQLAKAGRMTHAPRDGRQNERENLAQGLPWWSAERMIQEWRGEEQDYIPGQFPNVARDGDWQKVAHWTQEISRLSTEIGCAMARGSGFLWLDCRFSPGGNKDGELFGMPVDLEQPKLAPAEVVDRSATQQPPARTDWPTPLIDRSYVREKGKIAAYGDVSIPSEVDGKKPSAADRVVTPQTFEKGRPTARTGDNWLRTGRGDERDVFRGNPNGLIGQPSDPVLGQAPAATRLPISGFSSPSTGTAADSDKTTSRYVFSPKNAIKPSTPAIKAPSAQTPKAPQAEESFTKPYQPRQHYCSKQDRTEDLQKLQYQLIHTDESTREGHALGDQLRREFKKVETAPIEDCR
jgi:hypothetical protein